jgi:imidazole glycerol phosphate synthase subunit HisF
MKRKSLLVAFSSFAIATALVVSGVSLNTAGATSLEQLSAKADTYCQDCGSCSIDCRSGATNNIYPHHQAETY